MKKKLSKEEQLARLVQELYQDYDRVVTPLYPKIFIRVLPREMTYGSIILPDHQQSKTQWEAVVLSTWESFWRDEISTTESAYRRDRVVVNTENRSRLLIEPSVKVGDHILFPYHVGLPDPVFDEKKYRIISENDVSAVLRYETVQPKEYLQDLICNQLGNGVSMEMAVEDILSTYDCVRKDVKCKTRSGLPIT